MDRQTVLAAFYEQVRRHPAAEAPGDSVERDEGVVRVMAGEGGRSAVAWCGLDEASADAVIAATIDRFGRLGVGEWEWKYYSYDQPAQAAAVHAVAGTAHDGDDLLDRRWVCGIADPLVARRPAGMEVRQRGG